MTPTPELREEVARAIATTRATIERDMDKTKQGVSAYALADAAIAVVLARVAMWQPIETAPVNSLILAFCPGVGQVVAEMWCGDWTDIFGDHYLSPTHWMPLPAAPTAQTPDQEKK